MHIYSRDMRTYTLSFVNNESKQTSRREQASKRAIKQASKQVTLSKRASNQSIQEVRASKQASDTKSNDEYDYVSNAVSGRASRASSTSNNLKNKPNITKRSKAARSKARRRCKYTPKYRFWASLWRPKGSQNPSKIDPKGPPDHFWEPLGAKSAETSIFDRFLMVLGYPLGALFAQKHVHLGRIFLIPLFSELLSYLEHPWTSKSKHSARYCHRF